MAVPLLDLKRQYETIGEPIQDSLKREVSQQRFILGPTMAAERVTAAARRAGKILMVGHLLEYYPAVKYLNELIRKDVLGRDLLRVQPAGKPRSGAYGRECPLEPHAPGARP